MSQPARLPEVLRLQYLQAMGISSYYPRLQLPGALPSQACEMPPAETPAEPAQRLSAEISAALPAQSTHPATTSPPAQRPASAESARSSERTATERTSTSHAGKPTATAASLAGGNNAKAQAGEALHFQLLLLQVDADLAVVAQIPEMASPYLQDRQGQLLVNLLRWLGKPSPSMIAPRVFRWPLPGLSLVNNRFEAGSSLLHFLEQAFVEHAFRHALMLGEQAADCLLSNGERTSPWQLVATHSLDAMLALPQLKREAWQSLLPLHAALHAREHNAPP